MAEVISKKLLLFVCFILVFPLFVHPLESISSTRVRRMLKHSRPHETVMNVTTGAATHAEFHAAAHEVPSGPNPESNSFEKIKLLHRYFAIDSENMFKGCVIKLWKILVVYN
ncbi:hypothetical protein R6Q57_010847 [Mikania cordata]